MNFGNKKVLITGITGFVGSNLARVLVANQAKVSGLVRRRADGSKPKNLLEQSLLEKVELIDGDITDFSSVWSCLKKAQPDIIFHFAAQSYVPLSFINSLDTMATNATGTANLLEAIRLLELDPVVVFAGSSEEYGLVFISPKQYEQAVARIGSVYPEPVQFPELPINENNFLRPVSPYAVSKVHADYLMRSYHMIYGMKTIVSRGFNTEGAGRGIDFVTSRITSQVMKLKAKETDRITLGNVNAFRDWSHVADIVNGYCLLAEKGKYGDTYVQGSARTNSVLTYLLLSLQEAGYAVSKIESMQNRKAVEAPLQKEPSTVFGYRSEHTRVDKLMLEEGMGFNLEDKGIRIFTDQGKIPLEFLPYKYRVFDVPILLSDPSKIKKLGFTVSHKLEDIISEQLRYFEGAPPSGMV